MRPKPSKSCHTLASMARCAYCNLSGCGQTSKLNRLTKTSTPSNHGYSLQVNPITERREIVELFQLPILDDLDYFDLYLNLYIRQVTGVAHRSQGAIGGRRRRSSQGVGLVTSSISGTVLIFQGQAMPFYSNLRTGGSRAYLDLGGVAGGRGC